GSPRPRHDCGRRPVPPQRLRFLPRPEALEDRTVLSTLTVVNNLDHGPGSLRQAGLDANEHKGADTIAFAPGLLATTALTTGELAITDDVPIDGPGAALLSVSGSDASRIFRVAPGVTVRIDDLTLTRGRADVGGAVFNDGGNLTLANLLLTGNRAVGERALGGAVANLNGAGLVVVGSVFSGNQAAGPIFSGGGAMSNETGATLAIVDSIFSGNVASTT